MGNQLTAEQYIVTHWKKNKIWTHLDWPKHQARLNWCADNCVGETFADVGCGLGHSTAIMKARHPGAWTGIEFFKGAVEEAPSFVRNVEFLYAESPEKLAALGKFDSVVCSEVIEHVPDEKALLNGLLALARKRVILTTPCINVNDPGHVRVFTDETISELLKGLSAVAKKDALFYKVVIEV